METKNYYLGLDMGTASVGWAVTDEEYHLLRRKGKDLWGIREFETAQTAEERRNNRISRRRRQREVARIALVKEYFADELEKVDPLFLIRLQNSKYYAEDKDEGLNTVNGIFDDPDYQDKDYYKQFPTIFHLRKELIENKNAPYDVRLVYLAVLNLFKRRGHFLNSSLDIEKSDFDVNVGEAYSDMIALLQETFDENKALSLTELKDEQEALELQNILSDRSLSKKNKSEKVSALLGVNKTQKREKEIINGIVGLQIDCNKLFLLPDDEEKVKAKFSDFSYSDKEPELLEKLGEVNVQCCIL